MPQVRARLGELRQQSKKFSALDLFDILAPLRRLASGLFARREALHLASSFMFLPYELTRSRETLRLGPGLLLLVQVLLLLVLLNLLLLILVFVLLLLL